MKKKNLLTSFALTLAFLPLLASAQGVSTTSIQVSVNTPNEAQVFTACSQASIEIRDESIGSARTAYNNAMAVALDARKEAEKKAVAIENAGDRKSAIVVAVEEYKKAVNAAQEDLTAARKEAWANFETNTKDCRDTSKDKRAVNGTVEKKAVPAAANTSASRKADTKAAVQAEVKAEVKATTEVKTFREVIKEQIETFKSFFKMGGATDTGATVTM